MLLRTKLHGKTYEFPDIRLLMGKANEEKSGDRLAGVGAETAAERVAPPRAVPQGRRADDPNKTDENDGPARGRDQR